MKTLEGRPVRMVDLVSLHAPMKDQLLQAVGRVFDHGQFILGPEVHDLEARWAKLCGVSQAVSVSDGTKALFLTLKALGVGQGDEVITTPNSFIASTSCIVHAGAIPVFADVGEDFNIDPTSVEQKITPRTRCIIAVHLAGRPVNMDALNEIGQRHDMAILEDAAQAMGGRYKKRKVGSLGRAACFSLHPLKSAGACGDAGMITTSNENLADHLRLLRNHGITTRQEDCKEWGYNARMDTIQAAMVLVKLDSLDSWIEQRRQNAAIYRERIADLVRIPDDRPEDYATYHTFPVEADRRDALAEHLSSMGIQSAIHYRTPVHKLRVTQNLPPATLPVVERQAERLLSLPIHEGLTEEDIHRVCDVVAGFYEKESTKL